MATCPACKGEGQFSMPHVVYNPYTRRNEEVMYTVGCGKCGGSGEIPDGKDGKVLEEDKSARSLED